MDDSILEKIKKLLARGDENRNDNEHERAIAMRQAHALLTKHGLGMADVSAHEAAQSVGALGRTQVTVSRSVWQAGVYDQIARLNGCRVIRSSHKGKTPSVWIIGRHLHCEVVKSMAMYVCDSIRAQAKKEYHNPTQFGNGAWHGVTAQVREILANMAKGEINGEVLEKSTALVVVNQQKQYALEAQQTVAKFFPRTTSGTHRARGGDAYSAGKDYGRSVGLNTQVGGSGQRRLTQ